MSYNKDLLTYLLSSNVMVVWSAMHLDLSLSSPFGVCFSSDIKTFFQDQDQDCIETGTKSYKTKTKTETNEKDQVSQDQEQE